MNNDATNKTQLLEKKSSLLEQRLLGGGASNSDNIPDTTTKFTEDAPKVLSFGQYGVWFFDQIHSGESAYNMPIAYLLKGQLDIVALTMAIETIIERHESLRTTFQVDGNQPVPIIETPQSFDLPVVDLTELSVDEREQELKLLSKNYARTPFNLKQGPLFRAQLIALEPENHLLLVNISHMVFDGWSIGLFNRELSLCYNAMINNCPPNLPDLAIEYTDFTAWQRGDLLDNIMQDQLSYWRQQLSNMPAAIDFPTDHPRPAQQTFHGAQWAFELPNEVIDVLKKISRDKGTSLFTILLSIFYVLIYRYTGEEDLAVGAPYANRNLPELENIIGFFVNMLVLRADLSGSPTFSELLDRVHDMAMQAHGHQEMPFEKLVEQLQPERDQSRSPFFQLSFAYQNMAAQMPELDNIEVTPFYVHQSASAHDLTLFVWEKADGYRGVIEYNTDLFEIDRIKRMATHFTMLIRAVANDPEQSISQLTMLTESEKQGLLAWQGKVTDFDMTANATLIELFEQTVSRQPDAIAVTESGQSLSYAQLNGRSNQLARHLRTAGVGQDVLVAMFLERSIDMLIGLLAVLKAGGAYVPIDPNFPSERIRYILEDTTASILLTHETLLDRLPPCAAQIVCLDRDWNQIAKHVFSNLDIHRSLSDLAYVIYTSGSTGQPKGVLIEESSLLNYTLSAIRNFELNPRDCMLQFASISFDAAAEEIYPTLLAGANLVLRTDAMLGSAEAFAAFCEAHRVTILDLSTAYWHQLTTQLATPSCPLPKSIRNVIIGGERALPQYADLWYEYVKRDRPQLRLFNTYGPTEATIVATMYELTDGVDGNEIPIGKAVHNTQVYVLSKKMQLVPSGVTGELFIGGAGLARGYLNRPEQTAACFVQNPFSDLPDARLYKTGDLVRWRNDGQLEYVGRIDDQVKIRGFRIELGEIERALLVHKALKQAAVIVHENNQGGKRLIAFVVYADIEKRLTQTECRDFLRETLPEYMIPQHVITLDDLPLTSSGKVDRKALLALNKQASQNVEDFIAPQTDLEVFIAELWKGLFDVEQISVNDNFFELGGHSLLAIQFITQMVQALECELTLQLLFQHPSIATLATAVEQVILEQIETMNEDKLQTELKRER